MIFIWLDGVLIVVVYLVALGLFCCFVVYCGWLFDLACYAGYVGCVDVMDVCLVLCCGWGWMDYCVAFW